MTICFAACTVYYVFTNVQPWHVTIVNYFAVAMDVLRSVSRPVECGRVVFMNCRMS